MNLRHASWGLAALLIAGCDQSPSPPPVSSAKIVSDPPPSQVPIATVASAAPSTDAGLGATTVKFDTDAIGAPSPSFEGVVGDWYVAEEANVLGLKVDGSKWRSGEPSAGLAEQAKRLYGDRYAEFLDGVKAFAYFPFAIWKGDPPSGDMRISVRFFPIAGKIDQGAGIAFAIAPDGSYLGVRANALEDNMLYFRVVKGRRNVIDTVRNVSTPTKTWHTLAVELRGKQMTVELDGQKRFEKALDAVPAGRIGLWSKADSQVLFDAFTVVPLAGNASPGPPR